MSAHRPGYCHVIPQNFNKGDKVMLNPAIHAPFGKSKAGGITRWVRYTLTQDIDRAGIIRFRDDHGFPRHRSVTDFVVIAP